MKRVALSAIITLFFLNGFSQTQSQLNNLNETRKWLATTDFVYPYVDSDPGYPGGNEKWNKYVSSSTVITDAITRAKANNIPAGKYTIVVNFNILPDGKLSNFKTKGKKVGYGLEEAAFKLIVESGKWIPGHVEGMYRKSEINLPIHFHISY